MNKIKSTELINQTSVDPVDIENVEIELSLAYMRHYCNMNSSPRHMRKVVETLQRVGDDLGKKHKKLFKAMLTRLQITDISWDQLVETLQKVFDEMFADNHLNWGRIVTAYVFGACVSDSLLQHRHDIELAEEVAKHVGSIVHTQAHEWVSTHGGWVSSYFINNMLILLMNCFVKDLSD